MQLGIYFFLNMSLKPAIKSELHKAHPTTHLQPVVLNRPRGFSAHSESNLNENINSSMPLSES